MKINDLNPGSVFVKLSGLVVLLFFAVFSVQAKKITIGKGSGEVWEGEFFNASLSIFVRSSVANPYDGLLAIGDFTTFSDRNCTLSEDFYNINGYRTFKLTDGVGLIPRASGSVEYTDYAGDLKTLTGTVGLPRTRGLSEGFIINVPFSNNGVSYDYCIPAKSFAPTEGPVTEFFKANRITRGSISGTWVILANGNQKPTDNISLYPLYATSKAGSELNFNQIFPSSIDLRVSTLSCTVDTPVDINFGAIGRNTVPHAELAKVSNELYVSCSQESTTFPVKANINVQFRPISGLYNGEVNKLELNEKGGYITGAIPGATSAGFCGTDDGIAFNNTQIKVGEIEEIQSNVTLSHRLEWRLCSGGSSLPTGKVTASTEMLVTYN